MIKNEKYRYVLLALFVLLLYGNSIGNDFALDDRLLLLNNEAVHGLSLEHLRQVFTSVPNNMEYLPLRDLSLMVDYSLFKLNPAVYHVSNICYYVLFCLLLYRLLGMLLTRLGEGSGTVAFFAALFFVAHPVHAEVVAGISQRKDLLFGIFFCLSVITYLKYAGSGKKLFYLLTFCFIVGGMLSKAQAIITPAIIFALAMYLSAGWKDFAKKALATVPFFLAPVMIIAGQAVFLVSGSHAIRNYYYGFGSQYYIRIITAFKAIAFYVKLLFIPYPLNVLHDFTFSKSLAEPVVIVSLAIVGLLLALAWAFRVKHKTVSFFIIFFFIGVLPAIGLVPTSHVVAERYLFIPSVSFCVILALGLHRLMSFENEQGRLDRRKAFTRNAAIALMVVILGVYSGITYQRNFAWHDPISLYTAAVRDNPASPRLRMMVGREYFYKQDYLQAFDYFDGARKLNPSYGIDYNVYLALYYLDKDQPQRALSTLDAIQHPKKDHICDVQLLYQRIYSSLGDTAHALESRKRAETCQIDIFIVK
jgi:tetratricopeptide (TPR) repeat protein